MKEINQEAITHKEFSKDYINGWEQCCDELKEISKESLRDKFNNDYPNDWIPSGLGAYYYSKGYHDRLVKEF